MIRTRLRQFRFDWKLTLFTLLLLPVLVSLGFWQLSREQEKLELQDAYKAQLAAPAIMLDDLAEGATLQFRRILLQGEYDNAHTFLLDNRVVNGQVGFEVISPFYTDLGQLVFVNRGWAPMGALRSDLPEVAAIEGPVLLTGSIYVSPGEQVMLAQEQYAGTWPVIIQQLDIEKMSRALESNSLAFPYSVRLEENTPGVLLRNWQPYTTSPEKHRGYAVQWFSMATALLLLYLYVSSRPSGVKQTDKTTEKPVGQDTY